MNDILHKSYNGRIVVKDPKELLAEARAIHLAMTRGAITYERAKELTAPYLKEINTYMAVIAKKYNRKPSKFNFYDLPRGNF